jgi:mandelate racemase
MGRLPRCEAFAAPSTKNCRFIKLWGEDMSAPTIQSMNVRALRLPMPRPHRTAGGDIVESPLVLLDVESSDGVVGHAYVFTYSVAALVPTAKLVENLAPLVVGQVLAPEAVDRLLTSRHRLLGPQGLTGMAAALIDMALWDTLARTESKSLVRMLGAKARPLPAYGGIGYDGANESAKQAAEWVETGLRAVKPKIGYPTLGEDLAVLRAIRSAVGPDVAVMADYNQCLDPAEARLRLRALDEEGLSWIEEPITAHDFLGMSRLCQEVRTPIQAGENWWGPNDFATAIALNASDHLMPDVMKVGGVTGWMRVAGMASAKGLPVSNHLFPEVSAQLLCATPTAFRLEYAEWWNRLIKKPLVVKDGMALVDDQTPGSGVEWNEAVVSEFLVR